MALKRELIPLATDDGPEDACIDFCFNLAFDKIAKYKYSKSMIYTNKAAWTCWLS